MADIAIPEKTQKHLRALSQQLVAGKEPQIRAFISQLEPVEIADLLESLPPTPRAILWECVPEQFDGEILAELSEEVRVALIEDMDKDELQAAIESLADDDQVDLLRSLPEAILNETLQSLDRQDQLRFKKALSYGENTAGGLITTEIITVRAKSTVEVVMRYLRRRQKLPKINDSLIVVNQKDKYLGVVYINDLLTAKSNDITIAELIDQSLEAIPVDLPLKEVVYIFEDQDLISAPVVDTQGIILGRITIDDVVDVMRNQAEHTEMVRAGLSEEEDIFAPIFSSAKRRAVWLGINLLTAFLAAWVIGLFETTLEQIVALAVLMPIVASMGGIAGTQTLTIVIRGLALGQLASSNTRWLLFKEIIVSFFNGLIWAGIVAIITILWFKNYALGGIIAAAIIINLLISALAGVLIPLILNKLKIDPALAGGVILTTVTDVIGFFAFLGLATLLLLR